MGKFAAVGTDGKRPVVWGLGVTPSAALEEARGQLREAGHGGAPGYDDMELTTHVLSDAQAAVVEAGDVSWPVVTPEERAALDEPYEADLTKALEWARAAAAGEYLVRYEDTGMTDLTDPGSRCGYGDDELAEIEEVLGKRGLKLTADDRGLVAEGVVDISGMLADLAARGVRDDGTGDIGVIVRAALADDPDATPAEIADIVREAQVDAKTEADRE